MATPLNVGMIGYGFMGRAHSNAYRQVSQFFQRKYRPVLKACCGRNEAKIKAFAENWGYESYETDWRRLVERKDIDLIDIGSPNNTHREIALAAAAAGKMVLCEKPLAMNTAEAEEMTAAVERARRLSKRDGAIHRLGAIVIKRVLAIIVLATQVEHLNDDPEHSVDRRRLGDQPPPPVRIARPEIALLHLVDRIEFNKPQVHHRQLRISQKHRLRLDPHFPHGRI